MSFDPYHQWLGIPPDEQPPNHYRLLGIAVFEADPDVISNAAYRQLAHVKTFQLGEHVSDSQRLLSEIVTARICLLDADARAAYDSTLQLANPLPPTPPPAAPRLSIDASSRPTQGHRTPQIAVSIAGVVVALALLVAFVGSRGDRQNAKQQAAAASTSEPSSLPPFDNQAGRAAAQAVAAVDPEIAATDTDESQGPKSIDPPKESEAPRADEGIGQVDNSSDPVSESESNFATTPVPDATTQEADNPREKLPIPLKDDQAATLAIVKELYQREYEQAETYQQRSAAAKKVLGATDEQGIDANARYVLLSVARNMAVQAGDDETAMSAIDALDEQYAVDALAMKQAALQAWAKMTMPKETRAELAQRIPPVAEAAVEQERYDVAVNLLQLARDTARRAGDVQLVKEVVARLKEIDALAIQFAEVQQALEALANNPADEKANDVAGRYFCLVQGDWSRGLPFLARGSETKWKASAERDLRGAGQGEEQLGIGDMWWDLAQEEQESVVARQLFARAAYWYLLAAPNLNGLAKTKCEKRLADAYLATGGMLGGQTTSNFRVRSGLEFDGSDWVETDLQYDGQTSLTIEIWAAPAAHHLQSIVANNHGLGLALQIGENGHWEFAVRDKQTYRVAASNDIARLGELAHVAGVFDGRVVRLFVNGRLQESVGALTSAHKVSGLRFMIGADPDFVDARPQKHFQGTIDSVRVSHDIFYKNNFAPPASLVQTPSTSLLLQLDEGEGDVAKDTSVHKHHAKIHGAKWTKTSFKSSAKGVPTPVRLLPILRDALLVMTLDTSGSDARVGHGIVHDSSPAGHHGEVNGASVTDKGKAGNALSLDDLPAHIGIHAKSDSRRKNRFYNGFIDEFVIVPHALSVEEIRQFYQLGVAGFCLK